MGPGGRNYQLGRRDPLESTENGNPDSTVLPTSDGPRESHPAKPGRHLLCHNPTRAVDGQHDVL
jgi:hypothetical protein